MREILIITPIKPSVVSTPHEFADGIAIRDIAPIRWNDSIVARFVSAVEQDELARTRYWLCVAMGPEEVTAINDDELFGKARDAAMALQIISPTGAKHIFLKVQHTSEGWDILGSLQPQEILGTLLSRNIHLEDQSLAHFNVVYAGIRRASKEKLVRLQNPVLLLEHGMQIGNVHVGLLMFVMALDMLFMAGQISPFMKRLGGFLGHNSLIFPPVAVMRLQPKTTVGEVLKDLYDLRNIIAHGQEIRKRPVQTV